MLAPVKDMGNSIYFQSFTGGGVSMTPSESNDYKCHHPHHLGKNTSQSLHNHPSLKKESLYCSVNECNTQPKLEIVKP